MSHSGDDSGSDSDEDPDFDFEDVVLRIQVTTPLWTSRPSTATRTTMLKLLARSVLGRRRSGEPEFL